MGLIGKTLVIVCVVFSGCTSNKQETWNGVARCEDCPRMLPIWRQGICPECNNINNQREFIAQHLFKHD